MIQPKYFSSQGVALVVAATLLTALGAATPARSDDRQLFRQTAGSPYVFTMIDTSGSMHWATGSNDGTLVDGDGDAPGSRLYEAKSALYEVIQDLNPSIRLGLAHFNQENLRVRRKHWLYERAPGQANPAWWNVLNFPGEGRPMNFGQSIVDGNNAHYRNCGNPYTGGNPIARIEMFPKMQDAGTSESRIYVRSGGRDFRIRFQNLSPSLGATNPSVEIQVLEYDSDNCTLITNHGEVTFQLRPHYQQDNEGVPFRTPAGPLGFDYVSWDQTVPGSFSIYDQSMDSMCGQNPSWAPNNTPSTGTQNPLSTLRYQTFADPLGRDPADLSFHRGEMIPWDWMEHPTTAVPSPGFEVSSRQEILYRLAPNTAIPGEFDVDIDGVPIPDFRVARYLQDRDTDGNGRLDPKPAFQRYPPITNTSATPLEGMMNAMEDWYKDWEQIASDEMNGDPSFECRERFLILLTDGNETCGGTPSNAARDLRLQGIRVFVVAFGGGLSAGNVQSIADEGGTGNFDTNADGTMDCAEFTFTVNEGPTEDRNGNGIFGETYQDDTCPGPIAAPDRDSLVEALRNIFGAVDARSTSFASAATNPSRTSVGNSLFLSSFLPLPGRGAWSGSVAHYVEPLPLKLDLDGNVVPDPDKTCDGLDPARSCLAWDAGRVMVGEETGSIRQAPDVSEIMTDLRIGGADDQRRVMYALEPVAPDDVPLTSRLFEPPTTLPLEYDLWDGFGLTYTVGDTLSEATARGEALTTLRQTLRIKNEPDPTSTSGERINYILGDVFHSPPVLVREPSLRRFQIFDLNGYRQFFNKHEFRRQVILVGANDGQLHAFDAGIYDAVFNGAELDREESEHSQGSGQELFSFIPRPMLERIREKAVDVIVHDYGVDGAPRVNDFYVDPVHTGTPDPDDREWRTLAISGLREGGRSYFVLDITQPDRERIINSLNIPDPPTYVPTCMESTGYNAADCGPVPYASVRFEFTDTRDEDNNSFPDLGDTWSRPNTGRIRVEDTSGTEVERYVMIFGGGIDPENPFTVGNYLYMVDVETGKALYKYPLDGAAPSEPAAIDSSGDGFLDTVYIGTVAGSLYKVDISEPAQLVDNMIVGEERVPPTEWQPFKIFDTGGRPLFFPPSVINVGQAKTGLAFGTGYREDLWSPARENEEGRFYVLVDDFFVPSTATPDPGTTPVPVGGFSESNCCSTLSSPLTKIDVGAPNNETKTLIEQGGYYYELAPGEKLLNRAFTLSGITVFSTFVPLTGATTVNGEPICSTRGFTNIFTVFTISGDAVLNDGAGNPQRSRSVEGVVSAVFASDLGSAIDGSGDGGNGGNGGGGGDPCTPGVDCPPPPCEEVDPDDCPCSEAKRQQELARFTSAYPADCRFANKFYGLFVVEDDGVTQCQAFIPVCARVFNWGDLKR